MTDIAISVQNLSKCYQVYETPRDRLKQFFLPSAQRLLHIKPKQYFREFWALKDVSFKVKKGETIGVVGLNGSGKSTLLKMICGTLSATSGSVTTQGRIAALLELGSGFNPEFTGKENVYMNASILGLSDEAIAAKYEAIVKFADIGDFINQPVKTYSSGMYVRLAFAVIANVDADILIIDEALAVGDVLFSQKCMRFLREFKKNGTVLFVSHNSGAVVNLCDRAIWLDKGAVQVIGPAKKVCEKYLAKRYQSNSSSNVDHQYQNSEAKIVVSASQLDKSTDEPKQDMRMAFVNQSNLRNDIEVFAFSGALHGFGNGGVKFMQVGLADANSTALSWVVGGELVRLLLDLEVSITIENAVIGFFVKDRLGQVLFGENTHITYINNPVLLNPGEVVRAIFEFYMPILPRGKYAIDVAIADGSQDECVQLQWLHDALVFESHSSSVSTGLVGIPFQNIEMIRSKIEGNSLE
jgi:lipopolysaccharide transport system ATP-binding protein